MPRLWLSSRAGFTLIEALVVLSVLGVMILISAPVFFNQQSSSQDAEARRYLEQAYRLARTQSLDAGGKYGVVFMSDAPALTGAINLAYPEYEAFFSNSAPSNFRDPDGDLNLAVFVSSGTPKSLRLRMRSASGKVCLLRSANQSLPEVDCTETDPVEANPPTSMAPPSISGTTQESQVLTAHAGSWDGAEIYAYRWQQCNAGGVTCQDILNAEGLSYVILAADVGKTIRLVVTASNAAGSSEASSAATAVISARAPVNTALPSISGNAIVGEQLTSSTGTWTGTAPINYSYQWLRAMPYDVVVRADVPVSYFRLGETSGVTANDEIRAVEGTYNANVQLNQVGLLLGDADKSVNFPTTSSGRITAPHTITGAVSAVSVEAWIKTPATIGNYVLVSEYNYSGGNQGYYLQEGQTSSRLAFAVFLSGGSQPTATIPSELAPNTTYHVVGTWSSGGQIRVYLNGVEVVTASGGSGTVVIPSSELALGNFPVSLGADERWRGDLDEVAIYHRELLAAEVAAHYSAGRAETTVLSGATSSSYTLTASDTGASVRSSVTASNAGGSLQVLSAAQGPVLPAPPSNTVLPLISGLEREGQVLTTTNGSWTNSPTGYSYQWRQCDTGGNNCLNATGAGAATASYTVAAADIGKKLRVIVTATNGGGSTQATSVATGTLIANPPVNTVLPVISGTATVGQTLATTNGTWTSSETLSYSYQWLRATPYGALVRADAPVSYFRLGETSGTTANDEIRAVEGTYNANVQLNQAGLLLGDADKAVNFPTAASGRITAPHTITGAVSAVSVETWIRTGATVGTYVLVSEYNYSGGNQGYYLQEGQTSSRLAFAVFLSGGVQLAATLPSELAPNTTYHVVGTWSSGGQIRIYLNGAEVNAASGGSGTVVIPSSELALGNFPVSLGADERWRGDLDEVAIYHRELTAVEIGAHYDAGRGTAAVIPGATSSSYTLAVADDGANVKARVTASNSGGSVPASSVAVGPVLPAPPANTSLPVISGTEKEGQVLTTTNGAWSGSPTSYSYQWRQCDAAGANCVNAAGAGATTANYTAVSGDVGKKLRAVITAANSGGQTAATTAATGTIASGAPANTALPVISGTAQVSQVLTTTNGFWTDSPTGYSYQWRRCNTSGAGCIDATGMGATTASYTIASADVDQTLRVVVTATNPFGSTPATSTATGAVLPTPPQNTVLPATSGTVKVGQVVATTNGSWSPTPTSYSYQWRQCDAAGANCVNASGVGATTANYTIAYADLGKKLRAYVTATNSGGSTQAASNATVTVLGHPIYIGAGTVAKGSAISINVPIPATATAGRFLILRVAANNIAAITAPGAAWTVISSTTTTSLNQAVFYRVAQAGDAGANVTFTTGTTSTAKIGVVTVYDNVRTANPMGATTATPTAASSATVTYPAITTTCPNGSRVFAAGASNTASTYTTPSTFSAQVSDSTVGVSLSIFGKDANPSTSSASATSTISVSGRNIGLQFEICS